MAEQFVQRPDLVRLPWWCAQVRNEILDKIQGKETYVLGGTPKESRTREGDPKDPILLVVFRPARRGQLPTVLSATLLKSGWYLLAEARKAAEDVEKSGNGKGPLFIWSSDWDGKDRGKANIAFAYIDAGESQVGEIFAVATSRDLWQHMWPEMYSRTIALW